MHTRRIFLLSHHQRPDLRRSRHLTKNQTIFFRCQPRRRRRFRHKTYVNGKRVVVLFFAIYLTFLFAKLFFLVFLMAWHVYFIYGIWYNHYNNVKTKKSNQFGNIIPIKFLYTWMNTQI